ncbi:MAG: glycosyltransferase family 4 protein, partial [Ferruginibacter sp.]|nr:glycosyltransferase family 4 protein [Chitinophagaceae bacterium]
MHNLTLFLTLRVFSATGGIEKVSRVMGKALQELVSEEKGESLKVLSMYDNPGDGSSNYFPASIFQGFGKNKSKFVMEASRQGINAKQVILSHGNLLLAGYFIKLFSPKTRLVLIAHGIEVWSSFSFWKRYMLGKCDLVIAVSNFTKARMISVHGFDERKITVLNNCLDPFLQLPLPPAKNSLLLKRYALHPDDIVLITLTRLSYKERYKGYDNVLYAVKGLKEKYPQIRYLLVGKYDELEKTRMDDIITSLGLENNIIFTGFIPDEELAAHYNIADLYIMPSKKEGFGIVFIEAMYYGKPVIAGNKDGSADALANGQFGLLVNPDNRQEIIDAIVKVLSNITCYKPKLEEVLDKFSYPVYKENLRK